MACNVNYNFKLDFSNITVRNKRYMWSESIGATIPFVSDCISGTLRIIGYEPNKHNDRVRISFNGENIGVININLLKRGRIGGLLYNYLPHWKYEIGDIVKNLKILDRQVVDGSRKYKVKCCICGFDGGHHYSLYLKKYRDVYWVAESTLINNPSCPCCSSRIVVKEINDINSTDPWMIRYFKDKSIPYIRTAFSSDKVDMVCPHCGKERQCSIVYLKKALHLPCECGDNISMPNKIAFYTFNSIKHEIDYYEREYSPCWAGKYKYDNYFEYNGKKYIVEMDGDIGHGHFDFATKGKDSAGINRDLVKDILALEQGIIVIRVDCTGNDYYAIFDQLTFEISKIIPNVRFNMQNIFSLSASNIMKEVCCYYAKTRETNRNIAKHFNLNPMTVGNYLQIGAEFGWCNYEKLQQTKERRLREVINLKNSNPNLTTKEIAQLTGMKQGTVLSYLREGAKCGVCCFDGELESVKGRKRGLEKVNQSKSRKVYVYKDNELLAEYKSVKDLERKSEDDFGIFFNSKSVGKVCLGQRGQYKGYKFSYTML